MLWYILNIWIDEKITARLSLIVWS